MADAKKKESEEEAEATPAPVAEKSGGSKRILLIIGVVVLLIVAAGVPTAILLTRGTEKSTEELNADAAHGEDSAALVAEGASDEEELADDEERLGMITPMDTFVVNLSGGKYLRVQMQLEFQGAEMPSRYLSRIVPVRDGIIGILTKKTQADLESAKGRDQLKIEVKDLVNEVLHKEEVKRVYFTQFVIQ